MNDTRIVCRRQGQGALRSDGQEFEDWDRLRKAPTQCLPFDVLHDDEKFAFFLDDVVNCSDVRIAEARCPFRFFPKPLSGALVTTEVWRNALESHLTLQTKITCTVD